MNELQMELRNSAGPASHPLAKSTLIWNIATDWLGINWRHEYAISRLRPSKPASAVKAIEQTDPLDEWFRGLLP
jgi:hypothetical protein